MQRLQREHLIRVITRLLRVLSGTQCNAVVETHGPLPNHMGHPPLQAMGIPRTLDHKETRRLVVPDHMDTTRVTTTLREPQTGVIAYVGVHIRFVGIGHLVEILVANGHPEDLFRHERRFPVQDHQGPVPGVHAYRMPSAVRIADHVPDPAILWRVHQPRYSHGVTKVGVARYSVVGRRNSRHPFMSVATYRVYRI